ncbi:DNA-directed RNA polymerase I subunit RPA43 [Musca vetustissima]|uniref:DNA-directed RNA polymerase I subunit RPA43 n=1 Tax=Musca vetustissima TaxID=27455 RepID=UPI002AB5E6D0|nr:DNA-directed RNA polymerase I subunit RPA43 [Musca vetustissima]
MAKRLQEYVKYTIKELDEYVQTEGSCVHKINTNLHLSMGPFCLADFKHVLMAHIVRNKVGSYDVQLDGIVLDVKKVKVLGNTGALRADDPRIHVNINADVYVFKPTEGAVLTGVVKHIAAQHVGVVLYRVFNANLRVGHKVNKEEIQMDQEVKFRINKYNLQNVFPYIDGELLMANGEAISHKGKKIVFKDNENDNGDSGIEEKEGGIQELDELISIIKAEEPEVMEQSITAATKKSSKKSKKTPKENGTTNENSEETPAKKSSKKRKISSSLNSSTVDSNSEETTVLTPKKIKKEKVKSEDESIAATPAKTSLQIKAESSDSDD